MDRDKGRLALIVESRPWVDVEICEALERHGWDVRVERWAESALDTISTAEKFDALLIELVWPGLAGLQLADRFAHNGASVVFNTVSSRAAEASRLAGYPVFTGVTGISRMVDAILGPAREEAEEREAVVNLRTL